MLWKMPGNEDDSRQRNREAIKNSKCDVRILMVWYL
jgi:hypothetical protein